MTLSLINHDNSLKMCPSEADQNNIQYVVSLPQMQAVSDYRLDYFRRLELVTSLEQREKARCSFSHQPGFNLKASGMSRKEIAYMTVNQGTKSVEILDIKEGGNLQLL